MNPCGRPPKKSVVPSCKGGRTRIGYKGYVFEYDKDHPSCNKDGFVRQHRLVMEKHLGRYLTGQEVVHHIDRDVRNNNIENLRLMSKSDHTRLHALEDGNPTKKDLHEDEVRESLQGRTTAEAAKILGVHHMTLRNRFPHLLSTRRSPHSKDDPSTASLVLSAAKDPSISLSMFAKQTGISAKFAISVCDHHEVKWIRKSKKGEIHTRYVYRNRIPNPHRKTKSCD